MTAKADFTESECEQVLSGPPMAGLIVAAADHGKSALLDELAVALGGRS